MYDHDQEELAALGWEEFIARQWESIFVGYRTQAGLRRICRRWSDLLEAGLGCPPADRVPGRLREAGYRRRGPG